MNNEKKRTSRVLKTPVHKIPIGVPFKSMDGHYGLRIKKPQCPEYEELPLESLITMVVNEAETNFGNKAGTPF